MTKKATKPRLSFSLSGPHLQSMLGRFGNVAKTSPVSADRGHVLLATTSHADDYSSDELTICCSGHPANLIVRTTTGEGKSLLVHAAGEAVLDLEDLRTLISAMPSDVLDISIDELYKMRISGAGHAERAKSRAFQSQAMPADNYPVVARLPSNLDKRDLSMKTLCPMLERVRLGYEELGVDRPYLDGVLLEFEPDKLTAVATNGHVLAAAEHKMQSAHPGRMFLPRPLVELLLMLGSQTEIITVGEDTQRLYVESDYTSMSCLVPAFGFPPWREQRKNFSFPQRCELDALQLADAARALMTLSKLKLNDNEGKGLRKCVVVRVELKDQLLLLNTEVKSSELALAALAAAQESLDVSNPEQHTFRTLMSAAHIYAAAKQAGGIVSVSQNEELDPVLFESTDGFICIVMPLRDV